MYYLPPKMSTLAPTQYAVANGSAMWSVTTTCRVAIAASPLCSSDGDLNLSRPVDPSDLDFGNPVDLLSSYLEYVPESAEIKYRMASLFECRIEVYRDSNILLLKSNDLTVSRIARIFKVSYEG